MPEPKTTIAAGGGRADANVPGCRPGMADAEGGVAPATVHQSTAWPDPKRPGVPLHPERDGWHWLRYAGREPEPDRWNAAAQGWRYCGVLEYTSGPRVWSYVAPCPAPQDIEKRREALANG